LGKIYRNFPRGGAEDAE